MSTRLDRAQRGRHLPLPRRRVERRRAPPADRTGPSAPTAGRRCRPAASRAITISSAQLTASVNPQGRGTVAYFEYGTTSALGSSNAATSTPASGRAARRSWRRSRDFSPGRGTTTGSSPGATPAATNGQTRAFATTAGPPRHDRAGAGLGYDGRPDRHRRPVRALDELVVRAREDDVVRNLDRGPERRARAAARSPCPCRSPGSPPAPSTTHGSSPGARQAPREAATSSSARRASPSSGDRRRPRISLTRARIGTDVATSGLETRVWVEVSRRGTVVSRSGTVVLPPSGAASRVSIRRRRALARDALRLPRAWRPTPSARRAAQTASFGTAARPRDERGQARPLHDRRDERAATGSWERAGAT